MNLSGQLLLGMVSRNLIASNDKMLLYWFESRFSFIIKSDLVVSLKSLSCMRPHGPRQCVAFLLSELNQKLKIIPIFCLPFSQHKVFIIKVSLILHFSIFILYNINPCKCWYFTRQNSPIIMLCEILGRKHLHLVRSKGLVCYEVLLEVFSVSQKSFPLHFFFHHQVPLSEAAVEF